MKTVNECKKKYIKKNRLYPYFLYFRLDKWLTKMSLVGLHIVDCKLMSFYFERGEPKKTEYFTYLIPSQEGKYNIMLRHPFFEKKYGVSKNISKINANKHKRLQILEIDLNKVRGEQCTGYIELLHDRNKLYWIYFVKNVLAIIVPIIVLVLLNFLTM